MADLVVRPSYQLTETDILTVDKLNLMATPVVDLSLETPVNDQNYWRNGNFYSSFWTTPAGLSCPVGVETQNANYWLVNPNGAAVTCLRSSDTPDLYSLFSMQVVGAIGVTDCSVGQQINADLSAVLRRDCTVSGYIENDSGASLSPTFEVWTCNAFNDFVHVTLQDSVNLQTCANAAWTYVNATIDLSTFANVANGLFLKIRLPNGALSAAAKTVNFSRLKFQIGEIATEFVDDTSLFVQTPSIDSTMLQDGCIARSSLFLPNVVPLGAYQAGSIQSGDIGVGQVQAANLAPGINTTTSANFTVPAVNANVNISVTSAARIIAGLVLNIQGAGAYLTVSVADSVVTAQNTGGSNAAPGTVINSGAAVTTPGSVIGALGYTPVNKAGDTMTGALTINTGGGFGGVVSSGTNAIWCWGNTDTTHDVTLLYKGPGADRLTTQHRDVSGAITTTGLLLDSAHGVDNASYQAGSITIDKLAQSLINIVIPPGMVRLYAGPNIPSGWLVCDGSAVSRTTYAALFAAIGTYWGAGDAVSTFNLPDFRGRSALGYVNSAVSGITARAFASRGGEENHVLSVNELAYHNHTLHDGTHNHGVEQNPHTHSYVNPIGGLGAAPGSGQYSAVGATNTGAANANIWLDPSGANISIDPAGGNWAHNNMQPFGVLYFLVKT